MQIESQRHRIAISLFSHSTCNKAALMCEHCEATVDMRGNGGVAIASYNGRMCVPRIQS